MQKNDRPIAWRGQGREESEAKTIMTYGRETDGYGGVEARRTRRASVVGPC